MRLSIIVPVYKVEPYLHRCVDSILAQSFTDFELILVDDGSPDACPQICDSYLEKDPRIKVIHKSNGGLSEARNAGLDVAKGEYVGFVDSDDSISPDMYSRLILLAEKNNADIAACGLQYVDQNGASLGKIPDSPQKRVYHPNDFINNFYPDVCWTIGTMVTDKVFKRHLFDKVRFPIKKTYEDIAIQLDLYACCSLIAVDHTYDYLYYTTRNDSIMNAPYSVRCFDLIDWALGKYQFFKLQGNKIQCCHALVQYQIAYLRNYFPVHMTNQNLHDAFKPYKKQYLEHLPRILSNPMICKMHKLVTILLYINKNAAYRLCKRYLPQSLPVFLRS